MKWYVLRAVSGKEGKVKEYIDAAKKHNDVLETHVGEVLLPTEKYATLQNGKRVVKYCVLGLLSAGWSLEGCSSS